MLHDLLEFFGGVSLGGALALLAIGWVFGASMHGYIVWLLVTVRDWYAGRHD